MSILTFSLIFIVLTIQSAQLSINIRELCGISVISSAAKMFIIAGSNTVITSLIISLAYLVISIVGVY